MKRKQAKDNLLRNKICKQSKSVVRKRIKSEYVFCNQMRNGRWTFTQKKHIQDCFYDKGLKKWLEHDVNARSLGFQVTNNHAFRMSLNSNVFIPLGIPVTT